MSEFVKNVVVHSKWRTNIYGLVHKSKEAAAKARVNKYFGYQGLFPCETTSRLITFKTIVAIGETLNS